MEGEAIFLDTYAIYELLKGNEAYMSFSVGVRLVTTKLNLMEAYYITLTKKGQEYADMVFEKFNEFCIEISDDDFKKAMKFKAKIRKLNPRSNLSYIDAVGYMIAKKYEVKFLTGDSEFKGMDNVEFVR